MARKGWDALSPAYRGRLERAGLSKSDYESGQSLRKARGHQDTPEHPRQFNPSQFPKYVARRQQLTRTVEARKQQLFGTSPKWNPNISARHAKEKPPSMEQLRWALQADDEDILDAIREDPETYHFLTYH